MTIDEAMNLFGFNTPYTMGGLKRRYRDLAKKYHPDMHTFYYEKAKATKKFLHIQEAYEILQENFSEQNRFSFPDEDEIKSDEYEYSEKHFDNYAEVEEQSTFLGSIFSGLLLIFIWIPLYAYLFFGAPFNILLNYFFIKLNLEGGSKKRRVF